MSEEQAKYTTENGGLTLGIDPGPKGKGSGFAMANAQGTVHYHGQVETVKMEPIIMSADRVIIEMIGNMGMSVGMSIFQTLLEAGRMVQMCTRHRIPVYLVPRIQIKMVICGTAQAKDKNVRASLIDRYPASGGGKNPQIGTKKDPGPLFGMNAHTWPALAAALFFYEAMDQRGIDPEMYRYTEEHWLDYTVEAK